MAKMQTVTSPSSLVRAENRSTSLVPDDRTFRRALGSFLTGVTVVTSVHEGVAYGMTASSLASVSNDPPSLLVCLNLGSVTRRAVHESRRFTVSVLADEQSEVARVFSRAHGSVDKFDQGYTDVGASGIPYVVGALASMECRLTNECVVGTHSVLVGEISVIRLTEGEPLAYYRGGFGSFGVSR